MTNRRMDAHTTEDDLIRLLDGELDKSERARVQAHLEACWGCRHLQERIRKAMDRFAEWESEIACAREAQPPSDWRGFAARLRAAARIPVPTVFLPDSLLRRTVASLAGAALFAALLWLWPASTVSAGELLDRSSVSEKAIFGRVENPVVFQKIRIETPLRRAEGVFWNAPAAGKSRRFWGGAGDSGLSSEVERLYAKGGMNFSRPVSIFNHAAWRNSIANRQEDVVHGEGFVRLRTRNAGEAKQGDITEAEVLVRASDWHAVEQTFTVAGLSGRYRIVETAYEVNPLNFETARIFESAPAAIPARVPASVSAPAIGSTASENAPEAADALTRLGAQALVETEIEVLAMLREFDAGRREAAGVERHHDTVNVVLYSSDEDRTRFLTRELLAMPHVRLTVHALDGPQGAMEHSRVRLEPVAEKAEPPLFLRELAAAGGSLPVANLIAGRQMEALRRLRSDLVSLEDLAVRFPEDARRSLSPVAETRLLGLSRGYYDDARRTWLESISSSRRLLGALGIQPGSGEQSTPRACEWPQSAHDLAFGARRLEELYSRAFTSVAGAGTALRWMSKGALREEVATLHAALSDLFQENCRP